MKIFNIILGDIPNNIANLSFNQFIEQNKIEWWRYTALTYFIATPDSYDVKKIHEQVMTCFPNVISVVFEIDIKNWQGIGPTVQDDGKSVSFLFWFEKIKDPNFIPAWERDPITGRKYVKPSERLVLMETPKKEFSPGSSENKT